MGFGFVTGIGVLGVGGIFSREATASVGMA